jgi:monofunctional biosynthetic peptidoglycan transglycosylase
MERSDPKRPATVDPVAATPEPHKPAPDSEAAPASENALPQRPETDPFVEAEPEAIERIHFEDMERETTQPVRRYPFAPRSAHDITPADIGHAVEYEVPVENIADPRIEESVEAQPARQAPAEASAEPVWGDTPQPFLEPWPAAVEPPSEPPPPAPEPVVDEPVRTAWPYAPEFGGAVEHGEASGSEPVPATPQVFEPHPFEVPAPPHIDRLAAAREPVAPVRSLTEPEVRGPLYEAPHQPEPEPNPQPAPPLRHDAAAAWSPPPAARREPSFDPSASVSHPIADPGPEPASAGRDYRDLFRRAVRVGVIGFCGWFIAVLLLIVAFRLINPPFSMLMALQFMTGTPIHKQWVPIERISPNLRRAVIVAEDGRFCQHWGIDFIEAANAIRRASDGYPRGASTITMQVAKNLFLPPAKSYLRKLVEIPLTFAIELAWPKRRILEVYLNIVEWGPGVFGAEAASQAHFGRSAMGLTSRQAAQLAVTLPNPIIRDAGDPGPRTAHRASVIQARAARNGEASACVEGPR